MAEEEPIKCPTCGSSDPQQHPATQSGGEVHICSDSFHGPSQILPASSIAWRCFHCDEVFTDRGSARHHFGPTQDCTPICQVAAETYRKMEAEVESYRSETDSHTREFYALGAEHHQKLTECAQTNYDKGLADGRNPHMDEVYVALKDAVFFAQKISHVWSEDPSGRCWFSMLEALKGANPGEWPEADRIHKAIAAYEGISRSFDNELGNSIRIVIQGPTSLNENILTLKEGVNLRDALNEALQEPEPGSQVGNAHIGSDGDLHGPNT